MKTLIAYDSRYGTTTTVAHWLCEALGSDCDIANVADISSFDYDLIVIGSPIYTDEPLASVTQFLHEHRNTLSEKKVALFFVYDQLLTLKSEKYVEQLRAYAPPGVLAVGVFGGYFDINALNEHDRRTMEDFFERLGKRYEVLDHRNRTEVVRFGKLLKEKISEAPRST
jgi:menaquinone-dependent protoporphyrinogen IX oxidase